MNAILSHMFSMTSKSQLESDAQVYLPYMYIV